MRTVGPRPNVDTFSKMYMNKWVLMKHLIRPVTLVSCLVFLEVLASCSGVQPSATPMHFSPSPQSSQPPLTVVLTPLTPLLDPVQVTEDIFYTDRLKLNVYAPRKTGLWPVVVVLHGSGMTKEGMINGFSKAIAERGALVFTPTWRSDPPSAAAEITYGVEDVACAIRFARAKAAEYGGISSRLIVISYSAGGAAGAIITLTGDTFKGNCIVTDVFAYPDTFVGVDGIYDTLKYRPDNVPLEQWTTINPFTYLENSPFRRGVKFHLIVGSTKDLDSQALAFKAALDAAGYTTTLTQVAASHEQMIDPGQEEVLWVIEEALRP